MKAMVRVRIILAGIKIPPGYLIFRSPLFMSKWNDANGLESHGKFLFCIILDRNKKLARTLGFWVKIT